jgi:hypothetical protein
MKDGAESRERRGGHQRAHDRYAHRYFGMILGILDLVSLKWCLRATRRMPFRKTHRRLFKHYYTIPTSGAHRKPPEPSYSSSSSFD